LNLILINSNDNDSFAALYIYNRLHIVKSSEFVKKGEKRGRSPDKLINCLVKLRSSYDFGKIDAVSVTIGPGSFTGIRVGLALAKGIAGSLDKPLIPINNFDLQFERIINKDPLSKYCILIAAKEPEFYFSITKNFKQKKMGCANIEEIAGFLGKNTIIAGNFNNDSVLNHSYFKYIDMKKAFADEHNAMLDLSKRYYSEGRLYKPESVEPLYIKEFAFKKNR